MSQQNGARGPSGGIDLGGTKIQAVVLSRSGEVVGKARHPTPTSGGPEAVARAMADTMAEAAHDAGVTTQALAGVGVGSPGSVDPDSGTVARARNLPGWEHSFPLAERLSSFFKTPVYLGNDVHVATQAEYRLGCARGYSSLLGVFWGTGVGGSLVLNGKQWEGRGAAGEIGHVVVVRDGARCTCGRRGCMEAYAGRAAMELEARRRAAHGRNTALFGIMKRREQERLTSGIWAKALERKDRLATELIDRAIAALGAGIASAVNLLDVDVVMIGGGLGVRLGAPYTARIERAMRPHLFVRERPPAVHVAALGDLGGAIGAALLVAPRLGTRPRSSQGQGVAADSTAHPQAVDAFVRGKSVALAS